MTDTNQDIAKTCEYITDDKTVAAYHGVPTSRVRHVRRIMGRYRAIRAGGHIPSMNSTKIIPLGTTNEERNFRTNAIEGSAALLAALLEHFENRRNGTAA